MPTLVEISEDLLELEAELEEAGGDLSARDAVADRFFALCELEAEKLDNYAALIRELELRAEARKAEADRMMQRAKADAGKAEFLKERLKAHFIRHGVKTLETPRFRLTHAGHGGQLPVIVDAEADALPEPFRRASYSADTGAIREALESGQELPFARFGERGSSIRIR